MTETSGTSDRDWLYEELANFIGRATEWDIQRGVGARPKTDREIYQTFCPMHGRSRDIERDSWWTKKRVTRRAMLVSALRRLIKDGRITIEQEESLNLRSMHGMSRKNIEHRRRMFGKEFDGVVRTYRKLNILEGLVHALEEADA